MRNSDIALKLMITLMIISMIGLFLSTSYLNSHVKYEIESKETGRYYVILSSKVKKYDVTNSNLNDDLTGKLEHSYILLAQDLNDKDEEIVELKVSKKAYYNIKQKRVKFIEYVNDHELYTISKPKQKYVSDDLQLVSNICLAIFVFSIVAIILMLFGLVIIQ